MADSKKPEEHLADDSSELTPEAEAEDAAAAPARRSQPVRKGKPVKKNQSAERAAKTDDVNDSGDAMTVKRNKTVAPVKKKKPANTEEAEKRTGPVQFVQQVIAELKKVVWPTSSQTGQSFVVVLVFVLLMMTIVAGLDWLFGFGILKWLS